MDQYIASYIKSSSRARRVRITIYPDGRCVITVPPRIPASIVERFVTQKTPWIRERLARFQKMNLKVVKGGSRSDYLTHKERARTIITERLEHFQNIYGFTYHKVSIRNQHSRWGSCSKRGNLNFNYKLVHLPLHVIDYVVVHELCHLKELNHSKRFWDLVAQTVPRYKKTRAELKTYHFVK